MTKPVQIVFYGGFAIILLGILSPLLVEYAKPKPELPILGEAPPFTLQDSRGSDFSSAELSGKVWVANFIFTRCTGPCSTQSAHIAKLARQYRRDDDVRFMSISVDPEHDTPEVLADYADTFKADTSRWHFLHGSKEQVVSLLNEGFRLGSLDEPRYHSTRFVAVDRSGKIRGYYDGTDAKMVRLLSEHIDQLR